MYVRLVWGSLRLAPIIGASLSEPHTNYICCEGVLFVYTRRMRGVGGGASLSEHARCVSVLVIEVTMIVLMNNNHVNTIEEKELGIMWVLADTDPACL